MPILIRPVREQLEHDRIIRLLPPRYRRRFEVGINPGSEQNAAVGSGAKAVYPDAVLYSPEKGRKIQGVVEVETGESINHLEAMAQWASYGRLKVPFHLYVPSSAIDVARRLSSDHQVAVSELWMYDNIGDQVRFTLVQRAPEPVHKPAPAKTSAPASRSTRTAPRAPSRGRQAAAPRRKAAARPAPKTAKRAAPGRARKAAARGSAQKRR
jgi:hypothetical protein